MGTNADDIINGDVDQYSGEWLGNGQGFPRGKVYSIRGKAKKWPGPDKTLFQHKDGRVTEMDHDPLHFSKGTYAIRRELSKLIRKKLNLSIDKDAKTQNRIIGECRQFINAKYGKGWREQY